jgi:hypothetical protein
MSRRRWATPAFSSGRPSCWRLRHLGGAGPWLWRPLERVDLIMDRESAESAAALLGPRLENLVSYGSHRAATSQDRRRPLPRAGDPSRAGVFAPASRRPPPHRPASSSDKIAEWADADVDRQRITFAVSGAARSPAREPCPPVAGSVAGAHRCATCAPCPSGRPRASRCTGCRLRRMPRRAPPPRPRCAAESDDGMIRSDARAAAGEFPPAIPAACHGSVEVGVTGSTRPRWG